jgi:signal transduction histidine kinase
MNYQTIKKIKESFFWRISLVLLAIFVLIGVISLYMLVPIAKRYSDETTQKLNANVATHMLNHVKPFVDGKVDEGSLRTIMESMMAVNPGLEVYLLDPQGKVLSSVVLHQKIAPTKISVEPIQSFITDQKHNSVIYGDDPRNPGRRKVFSAAPIISDGVVQGYVYMILASREYDNITEALKESYLLNLAADWFFITLAAAFTISLVVLWLLMRSLRAIIHTVEKFSVGDFRPRIPIRCSGELTDLSMTINKMAETIVDNMEELREIDILRRDLIANISHDIRTPISIIHGYVETIIMKNKTLEPAKQAEYLHTIIKSTERLKRLVDDLFELSKLQSKQIKPKMETFVLSELVAELLGKYSLIAQQKNISLEADFPPERELVFADPAMVERVLQNLIDNAIRYSPENGKVLVTITHRESKISVSVSNTGSEIPSEQLTKIFDRYYKIENSKAGQGTGLGLAIVKNILEVLGSNISVQSENFWTTFSFNLPAVLKGPLKRSALQ